MFLNSLILPILSALLIGTSVVGQTELCKSFCEANQYSQTMILKKKVRFYFVEKNWKEALEACQEHGGNLLRIKSEAENNAVYKFIKERAWGTREVHTGFSHPYIWIAGTDQDQEGKFVWKPFNEPFEYTAWSGHENKHWIQPDNNKGEEHCVELYHYNNEKIFWNDAPCWERKRYLCEFREQELI